MTLEYIKTGFSFTLILLRFGLFRVVFSYTNSADSNPPFKLLPKKKKKNKHFALPKSFNNDISSAIEESRNDQTLAMIAKTCHDKRLNSRLKANKMTRITIYGDGDCFLNAALVHVNSFPDAESLRIALCNHIEENFDTYFPFIESSVGDMNMNELYLHFLETIAGLRKRGAWTTEGNDLLLLALANITGRRLKIFCSRQQESYYDVQPTLKRTDIFNPIYFAYLAIPGGEHYDGCTAENQHMYPQMNQRIEKEAPVSDDLIQTSSSFNEDQEDLHVLEQEPGQTGTPPATPARESPTPSLSSEIPITPSKRRGRKRRSQPDTWKRNSRKQKKLRGEVYLNSRGGKGDSKHVRAVDCRKYRKQCAGKINEAQGESIFDSYYSLSTYERQKDFICTNIETKETRTYLDKDKQPAPKKRQVHYHYSFVIDGNKVPVCKTIFMKTLDIGHGNIKHAMDNCVNGHFAGGDGRGKHLPANKLPGSTREAVRRHIAKFPAVESHYCTRRTARRYLASNLNITEMHRLYIAECKMTGDPEVSRAFYRELFVSEYNIAFHKPKKDQCLTCNDFYNHRADGTLTEEKETNFKEHHQRKVESREEKQKDKELATKDPSVHAATFDMEAILPTPCSNVSLNYYKRKLAVYNLSIFSLGDKDGSCYMWDETEGNKGSSEIGTCLYQHLKSLPASVTKVILYSDTCSGQNRNKNVAAALRFAVDSIPNIESIDQKFLESGHTHMECDSMHSAIERAKKFTTINVPDEWNLVVQMARKGKPYTVIPLTHESVLDFKEYAKSKLRNTRTDLQGNRVNWLKIKWIRYEKSDPDALYFKYTMSEPFKVLRIRGSSTRKEKQVQTLDMPAKRYKTRLPVAEAKKKDLLDLCKMGVIRQAYHDYYKSLPSSLSKPDCLPDSDMDDNNDTDEDYNFFCSK